MRRHLAQPIASLLVMALIAPLLLAGCTGTDEPEPLPRPEPPRIMPDPEALAFLLVEAELTRCGREGLMPWQLSTRHAPDGTMLATLSFLTGERAVPGTWRIDEDGFYCRQWSNDWGGGEFGCFAVAAEGALLDFTHVSGSAGDATSYRYSTDGTCPG